MDRGQIEHAEASTREASASTPGDARFKAGATTDPTGLASTPDHTEANGDPDATTIARPRSLSRREQLYVEDAGLVPLETTLDPTQAGETLDQIGGRRHVNQLASLCATMEQAWLHPTGSSPRS